MIVIGESYYPPQEILSVKQKTYLFEKCINERNSGKENIEIPNRIMYTEPNVD